ANVDAYGRAVPSSRFMGGREFEILSSEIGPVDENVTQAAIGPVIDIGERIAFRIEMIEISSDDEIDDPCSGGDDGEGCLPM
ncbi:hypothetical protein ACCT04_36400, partial [Rhizobium ruizarguesonis]